MQHHDRFKLITGKVKNLVDLNTLLTSAAVWAEATQVAPKSIGMVDLTYTDILLNLGYSTDDEPYPVQFIVKEVGTCEELEGISNEELEARLNQFEEPIENVVCHELVVVRVPGETEEIDLLVMVIMVKAA